MWRAVLLIAGLGALLLVAPREGHAQDGAEKGRCLELWTCTAPDGHVDALSRRFRRYRRIVFARHQMAPMGFWIPLDNPENHFVYMPAFPSRFARHEAWRAFDMDPEWRRVYEASRADGPLVENVESTLLRPTDYSPVR